MSNSDFTTTILVEASAREAFNAINNVRGWWSEEIEGGTERLNDEFSYHYRDIHRCKFRLIEVIPDSKVVWLVLDNYFNFTNDQSEWRDTKVSFEISTTEGKTQVRMTHIGLVPSHECFGICSNAWTTYIQQSLYNLITTGEGQPNSSETARTQDEKLLHGAGN